MGGDDDRDATLIDELAQQAHNRLRSLRVELRGGFVGNQEARLVRERAGDGNPLLLASG